jgi:hypothetical protein
MGLFFVGAVLFFRPGMLLGPSLPPSLAPTNRNRQNRTRKGHLRWATDGISRHI